MNDRFPKVLKNVFEEEYFQQIKKYLSDITFSENQKPDYYGSYRLHSFEGDPVLNECQEKITPLAKDIFGVEDMAPSYCTYIRYKGASPILNKHKDEAPSQYLIDLSLGYKTQWPLIVEGEEFSLEENEALAFYATEQQHWRPAFPDKDDNIVEMLMFGFVKKDHRWWQIQEKERPGIVKRFLALDSSYNNIGQ